MRKFAIVSKADIEADFTAVAPVASTAVAASAGKPEQIKFVQQQQRQDPQWLADIKRQQQEQSGAGDLFGFPFPVR